MKTTLTVNGGKDGSGRCTRNMPGAHCVCIGCSRERNNRADKTGELRQVKAEAVELSEQLAEAQGRTGKAETHAQARDLVVQQLEAKLAAASDDVEVKLHAIKIQNENYRELELKYLELVKQLEAGTVQ